MMTIRVRFAPSPTGLLHLGNVRAALINWLFAKRYGGSFLLRLDDTDIHRSEAVYAEAIHRDLTWLGLIHDQFMRQSDRIGRYDQMINHLKESGRLYPCYETPEELMFKRSRQLSRGAPPIYDRQALELSSNARARYEAEGRHPHWRFKLEPGVIRWKDLVRGLVEFQGEKLSDPVLIRADNAPLYTLTSVVDDIDTGITHILRGEDHVTNTAVQIQLFSALEKDPNDLTFAHTTLLVDKEGQALSKRLGSLSIQSLREAGIEPMAINSLLARLGSSSVIEPYLLLEDLVKDFDIETFSRTPPRFDPEELTILNRKLLQIMPYEMVQKKLKEKGALAITKELWLIIRENISTLSEISHWQNICFGEILPVIEDEGYIAMALDLLPTKPWDEQTWAAWTTVLKERTGRKGKALFMPLRQALTGLDHGPEMKMLLPLIGYERAQQRLRHG